MSATTVVPTPGTALSENVPPSASTRSPQSGQPASVVRRHTGPLVDHGNAESALTRRRQDDPGTHGAGVFIHVRERLSDHEVRRPLDLGREPLLLEPGVGVDRDGDR